MLADISGSFPQEERCFQLIARATGVSHQWVSYPVAYYGF